MKSLKLITILCVAILISLPSLAFAKGKPPPKDDPPQEDKVFSAFLTGALDGEVWTVPNTEATDPSNLVFNRNGGNTVQFTLSDYFYDDHYKNGNGATCFPAGTYGGSLQLYDLKQDTSLVGRFWFYANDSVAGSGVQLQYVISLYDDGEGWTADASSPSVFLPEEVGATILRDVTHWAMSTSKKKAKNVCVTSGVISADPPIIDVELKRVPICANPYVAPDCPSISDE